MITHLEQNEVFVFGSNTKGIHGKGAAKQALQWGAEYGVGFGLKGQTFAIPTKDKDIKTLPLPDIKEYVEEFITFAILRHDLKFLVTAIGCGLAGYDPKDIAPMFRECLGLDNVVLPDELLKELNK